MIVFLLGMHRSGTSALAGCLHRSGIDMGGRAAFFPLFRADNPRGYFEDLRFLFLDEAILRRNGYRTSRFPPVPATLVTSGWQRAAARALIGARHGSGPWGFKDPRACLLIDFWLEAMATKGLSGEVRLLVAFRHPAAVVESLERRGVFRDRALDNWLAYNWRLAELLNETSLPALAIDFADLLAQRDAVLARVGDFLDHPVADPDDFIRPEISRSRREVGKVEAPSEEAAGLWQALQTRLWRPEGV